MMIFRLRHLLWILPLFAVVLVLALVALADSWLESSSGRELLQKRMSESLGLPVRLNGDYSLKLFPRLKIAGNGLEIGQVTDRKTAVFSQNYSAVVELAPLVHRQVQIASIQVSGGYLDLSRLHDEDSAENRPAAAEMTWPQVESLEIVDFYIRIGNGEKGLHIIQLRMAGFRAGRESPVNLQAALLNGTTEAARVDLEGGLTIGNDDFAPQFVINEMTVNRGDSVIAGLDGSWEWDYPAARLSGRMHWKQARRAAEMHLEVSMRPSASGDVSVDYDDSEQAGPASLAFHFLVRPDAIAIDDLELRMADQSIGGSGCLALADTITLNLLLHAETLDLDRMLSTLDMPDGEGADMPVKLAIELRAAKAWFGGAEATNAVLNVGDQPDCQGP